MRTHFVYEAYDADGLLLYVGCTGKPGDRYRAHMRGEPGGAKGWLQSFVTHWRVSGPYEKDTALRIERDRIKTRAPIWNGQTYPNSRARMDAINEYLRYHGVQFVEHPRSVNLAVAVKARRGRGGLRAAS
jgi:hypothetical protein